MVSHKPSSSAPPSPTSSLTPPRSDDCLASDQALAEYCQGNYSKAQNIINESFSKHKNSLFLHHGNATIQFKLATLTNNPNSKIKHLYDSAKSAQRVTKLCPDKLSSSVVYVFILFELSKLNKEYDKVIQECDRALSINNPVRYFEDSSLSIEYERNKIRKFKETMNVVKILDLDVDGEERIKFWGNVKDKSTRDSELKEAVKKNYEEVNELKKRIEEASDKMKLAGLKKITENVNKTKPVRKFWNEVMSDEKKKRLLEVSIDELISHFDENNVAREVLMEAIGYAKEKRTWKFWECFCGEKFVDCEVGIKHYEEKHEGVLPEKLLSVMPSEVDNEWADMIENGDWRPVDTLAAAKIIRTLSKVDKEWPLSDDTERAKFLERIRCMLQLFLTHKCLAMSLLRMVIEYARSKLLALIPAPQFKICKLDKTLHCLRLLGVPELKYALKILQVVCNICDLTRLMQDEVSDNQVLDIKERIVFSSDFKCLLLDERLSYAVADDGSAVPRISDNIITWLYSFPIEEQVAPWTQLRGDKLIGFEVFEVLDAEFSNLKSMYERKCDLSTFRTAVCAVDCIFLEENNRRKQFQESERQSYASLLRERRKELVERDGDAVFRSSQLQLDAIRDVLEEALSLSFNQFKSKECNKGDDWMIEQAISRKNTCLLEEDAKIDAIIMRNVAAMQQFKLKLRQLCAYDYRSIMLPLLKFFILARLENLVDKDASEKSEAAQEAFLGTDGNEDLLLHQEAAEQVVVSVASLRADELEVQEEELRHKIELGELASKHLAETLEYQRQFENEAKEKCFSEQKTAVNMTEGLSSSYYEKSQQDHLVGETGIPKVSSSFPECTVKGTKEKSSSVSGTQQRKKRSPSHAKFEQGPPNQRKPDGVLPSDQRKECQSSDPGALLTEKEMQEGGRVKILDQENVQRSNSGRSTA